MSIYDQKSEFGLTLAAISLSRGYGLTKDPDLFRPIASNSDQFRPEKSENHFGTSSRKSGQYRIKQPAPSWHASDYQVRPSGQLKTIRIIVGLLFGLATAASAAATDTPAEWRADKRLIDMHQHIEYTTQRLERAVRIMDSVGIG